MKTIKKVSLVSTLAFFYAMPMFLQAQKESIPLGAGQKVVINKIENGDMQNYSSTIVLNDIRKQLIMAGQNYQTNYGIYATIEIGKSSMGENYKTLKSIEFEIVNYKPTYFIGIDSIIAHTTKDLKGFTLKIYTRAMSDKNTNSLDKEIIKNIHFEKDSYLHCERILNPMFPNLNAKGNPILMSDGSVSCAPDDGKAFDFEFFYKDGQFVMPRKNYDNLKLSDETYLNESASGMPGFRCKQSFNKISF
jgi:hypothetical protein